MMHETARRSRVLPVQKRGGGEAVCTRGARGQEEEAGAAPDGAVCTRRLAREETYATTRLASSHAQRGGDGAAAMASAHGEHRQHGERVCIDCRPPKRLELEVRAHDVLAWGGRGVARREGGAREARRCWVEERWYRRPSRPR